MGHDSGGTDVTAFLDGDVGRLSFRGTALGNQNDERGYEECVSNGSVDAALRFSPCMPMSTIARIRLRVTSSVGR